MTELKIDPEYARILELKRTLENANGSLGDVEFKLRQDELIELEYQRLCRTRTEWPESLRRQSAVEFSRVGPRPR